MKTLDTLPATDRALPSEPPRGSGLLERIAGGAWFLLLATVLAYSLGDTIRIALQGGSTGIQWPALLSKACVFLFYATLGWLMLVRPKPIDRMRGVLPTLIAFAGTYAVWLLPLMPRGAASPSLQIASAAILLLGSGSIVYVILHLGRSFSIAPQARKLVTTGPYAVVRHPLYVAEEIATIGALLQYAWFAALPFLVAHLLLQFCRMRYEEAVLRRNFPEYDAYARRTSRVLPGIW